MPPVPTGYAPNDIVLTPLDGDMTKAAHELREALRAMVQVRGKAGTKTLLTALAAAN